MYYLASRYYDPGIRRFISADDYMATGKGIFDTNMYIYCENNPINRADYNGNSWKGILNSICYTIKSYIPMYTGLGSMAVADGALPVGDTLAVVGGIAITSVAVGVGIYNEIKNCSKNKEKVKVDILKKDSQKETAIYRYGGTNPGNLIPREIDVMHGANSGLSFSTIPKQGAAMTTIEAVNATGVLYAIQDGLTHVSVYPVGITLQGWRDAGTNSVWTVTLKSIVVKWTP